MPHDGLHDERGFTLIELLVVILIIGILAAIALPTFLRQADKARDAQAKSDVRNVVSQMEACFREDEMYTGCPNADHPLAPGAVAAVNASGTSYVATRTSDTGTTFTISRLTTGYSRTCSAPGIAGCQSNGSW